MLRIRPLVKNLKPTIFQRRYYSSYKWDVIDYVECCYKLVGIATFIGIPIKYTLLNIDENIKDNKSKEYIFSRAVYTMCLHIPLGVFCGLIWPVVAIIHATISTKLGK